MVVISAAEATVGGDSAVNLDSSGDKMNRSSRASTSGSFLIVTIVATTSGTTATIEAQR